ncbi:LysE family transporter [Candidatus Sumerlaeota bacterium]|nr:LysE family transporter [Candidatus Sumerlaeota bacterium]
MGLKLFGAAYILGLSVAAPIGPVNVEIIRRGLTIGPAAAFFLGCGAVSADCIYFALALAATGLASTILNAGWGVTLGLFVAGGMLNWIGWISLKSRAQLTGTGEASAPRISAVRSYLFGLGMTLANPLTIALWLSIAASFSASREDSGYALLRLLGVGAGALSWVGFITSLLALARRAVTPKFLRTVNVVSGLVLIYYGLRFWMEAVLRAGGN